MRMPRVFVISGPSGAGKSTLLKRLFKKRFVKKNFLRSISFTTRQKRKGEIEGRDYFFVDKNKFLQLKNQGFFLEVQRVLNDFYGTPKFYLDLAKKGKKDLVFCIDVKGGKYLKNNFKKGKIITIFVSAPNERELCQRLKKRNEVEESIKARVKLAKKELQYLKYYDYLIVNQNVEESLVTLESILRAEKVRRAEVV